DGLGDVGGLVGAKGKDPQRRGALLHVLAQKTWLPVQLRARAGARYAKRIEYHACAFALDHHAEQVEGLGGLGAQRDLVHGVVRQLEGKVAWGLEFGARGELRDWLAVE